MPHLTLYFKRVFYCSFTPVNLVIDIGNTLTKAALFEANEVVSFSSYDRFSTETLNELISKHPSAKNAILSSVADHDKGISELLRAKFFFIELNHQTRIPLENLYKSPETGGKDRLACAVGANALYPGQNILAVDAGTCIKYDFVNAKNQYLGGGISPGIEMRFHSFRCAERCRRRSAGNIGSLPRAISRPEGRFHGRLYEIFRKVF